MRHPIVEIKTLNEVDDVTVFMKAVRLFNKNCGNETGKKRKIFPFHERPLMYLGKNEVNLTEFM